MKIKKFLAMTLALVLVASASIFGTLAYLTSTDEAVNTFVVGYVKIDLIESQLHRTNAGGNTDNEAYSAVEMTGNGCYTDDQIKADAAEYECDDVKLNPGQSYHKMPYVVNTGANDAWIRIRVMIPADLDTEILNSSVYTASALDSEFKMIYDNSGTVERTVEGQTIKYNVYTFTRQQILASGAMTYWNVWNTIHMDSDVTNEELAALFGENGAYSDGTFPVLVEADAIQADGLTLDEAWTAFDGQSK